MGSKYGRFRVLERILSVKELLPVETEMVGKNSFTERIVAALRDLRRLQALFDIEECQLSIFGRRPEECASRSIRVSVPHLPNFEYSPDRTLRLQGQEPHSTGKLRTQPLLRVGFSAGVPVFEIDLECVAEEYMGGFVEESLSRQLGNRVDGDLSASGVALAIAVGLGEGNLCDFKVLERQDGIPVREWWEFYVWAFGL